VENTAESLNEITNSGNFHFDSAVFFFSQIPKSAAISGAIYFAQAKERREKSVNVFSTY